MGAWEARAKRELRIVEAFGRPLSDAGSIPAASIIERGPHTGEGLFFLQNLLPSIFQWTDQRFHQGEFAADDLDISRLRCPPQGAEERPVVRMLLHAIDDNWRVHIDHTRFWERQRSHESRSS